VAGDTWKEMLPGPYVDIELLGDARQVDNMLRGLYTAFEDENIGYDFLQDYVDPILRQTTEARFASEGDATTGPWAPLAEATVHIRESMGYGGSHPINVRTGAMKKHLVDDPPRIAVHSLGATMWSPGTVGDSKMQAKVKGAQGIPTPVARSGPDDQRHLRHGTLSAPPRPVLGVGEQDLQRVMVAMSMYLGKHVAAGGAEVNFIS